MTNKKNSTPAQIFTIGFTKKSAENFFELLELHGITELIDVRLYNNTQLAGFAKGPDLKFFLNRISSIEYRSDLKFAPTRELFKNYQENLITWEEYVEIFEKIMQARRIIPHILTNYSDSPEVRYCLLCTEVSAAQCHRRLVAEKFVEAFGMEIVHL
jgi:uncharacterized protein (DUF488 family)